MMRQNVCKRKQAGITLIELVISLIVMSIIIIPVSRYLTNSVQAYVATTDNINGTNEIRYAMNRLSQEIRQMSHNGTQYEITTPASDMTSGNLMYVNTSGATMTINYTANVLSIKDDSVSLVNSYTLANQVTAFNFNYYQIDGTLATDGTNLAFVEFEMTLQQGSVSYQARSRVALRDKR